jgi:hypothetical protein
VPIDQLKMTRGEDSSISGGKRTAMPYWFYCTSRPPWG